MTRVFTAIAALLLVGFATVNGAPRAHSQTGPGWIQLFDGKTLNGWTPMNDDVEWRVEDGALVADKKKGKGNPSLVTKNAYKDFEIYAEFWVSDDANSRHLSPLHRSQRTSAPSPAYEVNIFDTRPDPNYGTGCDRLCCCRVNPMPKAGGKWNTFEITARGPLHDRYNERRQNLRTGKDGMFAQWTDFTLQYGIGRGEIPQGRGEAALGADTLATSALQFD